MTLGLRLAWLYLRQRHWQSLQIAFLAASFILAGAAIGTWWHNQHEHLLVGKQQLSVSLLLDPAIPTSQAKLLASDLQSLAPSIVKRIEVLTDSSVAQQLQARYGIQLDQFAGDSLLPSIIRFYFHPSNLTADRFYAFVEQCYQLTEAMTVTYPTTKASQLFENEQQLLWIGGILVGIWTITMILLQGFHYRWVLPLSRPEAHTLLIVGASGLIVRAARTWFALPSLIIGIGIATTVIVATIVLSGISTYPALFATASAAACVTACGVLQAFSVTPK